VTRPRYIRLIGDAWAEYPNCILDVDGEVPELRALATYFAEGRRRLWVAEEEGRLVGMVATRPCAPTAPGKSARCMWRSPSAAPAWRTGLLGGRGPCHPSRRPPHRALDRYALRRRACLLREARLRPAGSIRILDDLSKSLEFRYAKPARGVVVEALDAAAAASAERRLAEILVACVADGAFVSYLPPLSIEKSRSFWKRKVSSEVAQAIAVLLGAWVEGALVGTVQLDLATPQNQQHRTDLVKLLVHPGFPPRGVGEALMRRAEQTALRLGRRLHHPRHQGRCRRREALSPARLDGGRLHPRFRAGRLGPGLRHTLLLQTSGILLS
jgi:GNAT superfamily N-acetyltransferase